MKQLNKDDLYKDDRYTFQIEVKDQAGQVVHTYRFKLNEILKNQEKAEKWDKATTVKGYEEFLENKEIVERLKKEILSMSVSSQDYHSYEVGDLLEEILGEKKNE